MVAEGPAEFAQAHQGGRVGPHRHAAARGALLPGLHDGPGHELRPPALRPPRAGQPVRPPANRDERPRGLGGGASIVRRRGPDPRLRRPGHAPADSVAAGTAAPARGARKARSDQRAQLRRVRLLELPRAGERHLPRPGRARDVPAAQHRAPARHGARAGPVERGAGDRPGGAGAVGEAGEHGPAGGRHRPRGEQPAGRRHHVFALPAGAAGRQAGVPRGPRDGRRAGGPLQEDRRRAARLRAAEQGGARPDRHHRAGAARPPRPRPSARRRDRGRARGERPVRSRSTRTRSPRCWSTCSATRSRRCRTAAGSRSAPRATPSACG